MKNNDNNTPRHPVLDLLAKYRAIFQAAWSARGELAGPQRLADEAAFLPAALSLQSTPVHPAPRRLAWVLMALFVLALLWACLGQIDIVAVASGRVVVSERTKVIQPLERSVVQRILVKDGDRVTAGQSLVELDAIAANADKASVQEQLRVATIDTLRARQVQAMLLNSKQGRQATPRLASDLTDPGLKIQGQIDLQVHQQVQTEWSDISARLAKLNAESARRQAEIATAQAVVSKLEATVPMAQSREVDFKRLVDQGYMSSHATQDKTRERVELERDLTTQRARLLEAQAALSESANNKSAYLAELMHSLNDRETQADLKRSQAIQELAKATQREKLTTLTAPVDGVVQQLAIFTAGGVVTEAQALMVIVPEAAQVTAEVTLDNKDIGFVNAGQAVTIKLETFPYTRYGTLPAVVTRVTSDAVNDEKRGAIFPATLALGKTNINIDGKVIKLSPGMNVTAEIKTGQRRVIEYLLSPIQKAGGESLRER
ncbi:MAG: HlyD family type I secretion periplasmic adaptor subunit [Polaromonas sp.]